MDFKILPNKALQFSLDLTKTDEVEDLQDALARAADRDIDFMAYILETYGWTPNGRLYLVAPVAIGALTEAPILTDDLDITDAGEQVVRGEVWWYPQYQVQSYAEELLREGSVIFAYAPSQS